MVYRLDKRYERIRDIIPLRTVQFKCVLLTLVSTRHLLTVSFLLSTVLDSFLNEVSGTIYKDIKSILKNKISLCKNKGPNSPCRGQGLCVTQSRLKESAQEQDVHGSLGSHHPTAWEECRGLTAAGLQEKATDPLPPCLFMEALSEAGFTQLIWESS